MKIKEMLRKRNRTLLEVDSAVVFWTLAAIGIGFLLPLADWGMDVADWCAGIGIAALWSLVSLFHMQRCLEKALDLGEGSANRIVVSGYLIRYTGLALIVVIAIRTGIADPVVLCLGYILIVKVAVYSQPFTHKLYNLFFHETDPVPEPVTEDAPGTGKS